MKPSDFLIIFDETDITRKLQDDFNKRFHIETYTSGLNKIHKLRDGYIEEVLGNTQESQENLPVKKRCKNKIKSILFS